MLYNIMMRIIIAMVLIISSVYSLNASDFEKKINENWRWTKFDKEDGLPSDYIYQTVEANDATIWAMTPKGFAYYDGYTWHTIMQQDIKNMPRSVMLPFGSESIISVYKNKLITANKKECEVLELKYGNYILEIKNLAVLSKDSLLILAREENSKEYHIYLKIQGLLKLFPVEPPDPGLNFLHSSKNGGLWAGTKNGLYKWNGIKWEKELNSDFYDLSFISKPESDSDGNTLFSVLFPEMTRGTWFYSKNEKPSLNYPDKLYLNKQFYFSPDNFGLAFFYEGSIAVISKDGIEKINKYPGFIDEVISYNFTHKGDLVFSSADGVYICRLSSDLWIYKGETRKETKAVHAIVRMKNGDVWCGTDYGIAIYKLNGDEEFISEINGSPIINVTGLIQDDDANIWISSGGFIQGTYRWDGKKWEHFHYEQGLSTNLIHKIKKDSKGRLWFLTLSDSTYERGNGAFIYENGKFYDWGQGHKFRNKRIYDFVEDSSGNYWFATVKGLSKYDGKTWKHWQTEKMMDNGVFSLAIGPNGNIWYANRIFGIGYIENDTPKTIPELDAAEVLPVWNIKFDQDGRLWIATQFGLFIWYKGIISHINNKLGLKDMKLWPLLIEKNQVMIGTYRGGLNILNTLFKGGNLPRIDFDQVVAKESRVFLQWKVYSYFGMIPKDEIEVRYRIDSEEWSAWTKELQINYFGIEPGNHTFEIQAKNLFGYTSEDGRKINFDIPFPFYRNPIFITALIGILIMGYIITILIRKNIAKKKANQEIEERNFRITLAKMKLEEQNAFINEQNTKLKELNNTKDKFFSIIAHDLINPFNSFLGNTRFLKENYLQLDDTEQKECINDINHSAEGLFKLLQNLLQWANAQRNKIPYNPESCNIHEILSTNFFLLNNIVKEKKVKLISHIDENVKVFADYEMINTVFRNLISNAIKFTPQGGLIEVYASSNGTVYEFSVVDSGIGINKENIKKLFRPDVHHTTPGTSNEKGTGLGLIICKEFIHKNNGRIWVESEPGKGSKFNFTLPKVSEN